MAQFDELFEKYFTSSSFTEPLPLKKQKSYDDSFLGIVRNEDKGTSFFKNFINNEEHPLNCDILTFEVTPSKTYVFNDLPGILNLD